MPSPFVNIILDMTVFITKNLDQSLSYVRVHTDLSSLL